MPGELVVVAMTTHSQIESLKELKVDMNERQQAVYDALLEIGPATYVQVCEHLNTRPNNVTGRITELMANGWVVMDGTALNKATNRNNTTYRALTIKGPGKIVGHKKDGLYINRNDVQAILDRKEIHTKDYDIWFGKDVLVVFHRIFLEMRDVKAIGINDSNMMYFANEGATLKVPII